MTDIKSDITVLLIELKQKREELEVKLGLAKLEARDEWESITTQLAKLEDKARELGSATADASEDIGAAAKLLGQEIRDGFKKIAQHF